MSEQYARDILRRNVALICQNIGWNSINLTPMDILVHVLEKYILTLGTQAARYAEQLNRTEPNLHDLGLVFRDMNMQLPELAEYTRSVPPIPQPLCAPVFPKPKDCNLNFLKPGTHEVVTRPMHVHEHLPPMYPEKEQDTPLVASTIEIGTSPEISGTDGADKPKDPFKGPYDFTTNLQDVKRPRLRFDDEERTREISSVIMTMSGFLSPAREGKLPEARPPMDMSEKHDIYKCNSHYFSAPKLPTLEERSDKKYKENKTLNGKVMKSKKKDKSHKSGGSKYIGKAVANTPGYLSKFREGHNLYNQLPMPLPLPKASTIQKTTMPPPPAPLHIARPAIKQKPLDIQQPHTSTTTSKNLVSAESEIPVPRKNSISKSPLLPNTVPRNKHQLETVTHMSKIKIKKDYVVIDYEENLAFQPDRSKVSIFKKISNKPKDDKSSTNEYSEKPQSAAGLNKVQAHTIDNIPVTTNDNVRMKPEETPANNNNFKVLNMSKEIDPRAHEIINIDDYSLETFKKKTNLPPNVSVLPHSKDVAGVISKTKKEKSHKEMEGSDILAGFTKNPAMRGLPSSANLLPSLFDLSASGPGLIPTQNILPGFGLTNQLMQIGNYPYTSRSLLLNIPPLLRWPSLEVVPEPNPQPKPVAPPGLTKPPADIPQGTEINVKKKDKSLKKDKKDKDGLKVRKEKDKKDKNKNKSEKKRLKEDGQQPKQNFKKEKKEKKKQKLAEDLMPKLTLNLDSSNSNSPMPPSSPDVFKLNIKPVVKKTDDERPSMKVDTVTREYSRSPELAQIPALVTRSPKQKHSLKHNHVSEPEAQVSSPPSSGSKDCNLKFLKPGCHEVVTGPMHVHEHLPPMYPEKEQDTPLVASTIEIGAIPEISGTDGADKPKDHFKRPYDFTTNLQDVKRPRSRFDDEERTREISSVMMTMSELLLPAREGKLPETRPPMVNSEKHDKYKCNSHYSSAPKVPTLEERSDKKSKENKTLNGKVMKSKKKDKSHKSDGSKYKDSKLSKAVAIIPGHLNKSKEGNNLYNQLPMPLPLPKASTTQKTNMPPPPAPLHTARPATKQKSLDIQQPHTSATTSKNFVPAESEIPVPRNNYISKSPLLPNTEPVAPPGLTKPPADIPQETEINIKKKDNSLKKDKKDKDGLKVKKEEDKKDKNKSKSEKKRIKEDGQQLKQKIKKEKNEKKKQKFAESLVPKLTLNLDSSNSNSPMPPSSPDVFKLNIKPVVKKTEDESPSWKSHPPSYQSMVPAESEIPVPRNNYISKSPLLPNTEPVAPPGLTKPPADIPQETEINVNKKDKSLKMDKKDKDGLKVKKEKDKKDKNKSKSEKKRIKEDGQQLKQKIKKEKNEKKKQKFAEGLVPKLTLNLDSSNSNSPMPPSSPDVFKLNIKPVVKKTEDESPSWKSHPPSYQSKTKRTPLSNKGHFDKETAPPSDSVENPLVPLPTPYYIDEHGIKIWLCPACGRRDNGSPMIGCDSCDSWYHFICVGITEEPGDTEDWFCKPCAKRTAMVLAGVPSDKQRGRKPTTEKFRDCN